MEPPCGSVDREVARIATRQQGVVKRSRLLAAGLSREAIRGRVRRGLLHREYPGVYRLGHRAPRVEAGYMAAVLACGEGAALSGLAAAFLYGLVKGMHPCPRSRTEDAQLVLTELQALLSDT